jgi:hypothetical protein
MKKSFLIAILTCLLVPVCYKLPAIGHPQASGNTAIVSGIEKFWIEPTELMLSLGLSSLAIQVGKQRTGSLFLLLPTTWILGALAGFYAPAIVILNIVTTPGLEIIGKNPSLILALGLIVVGGLVAADQRMDRYWFRVLVILEGLFSGLINGLLLNGHPGGFEGLSGEWATMGLFVFLATYLFQKFPVHWANIAIRVIGSWVAAAGILLLGFYIKNPQ